MRQMDFTGLFLDLGLSSQPDTRGDPGRDYRVHGGTGFGIGRTQLAGQTERTGWQLSLEYTL